MQGRPRWRAIYWSWWRSFYGPGGGLSTGPRGGLSTGPGGGAVCPLGLVEDVRWVQDETMTVGIGRILTASFVARAEMRAPRTENRTRDAVANLLEVE